jgi:hypothetical protein
MTVAPKTPPLLPATESMIRSLDVESKQKLDADDGDDANNRFRGFVYDATKESPPPPPPPKGPRDNYADASSFS